MMDNLNDRKKPLSKVMKYRPQSIKSNRLNLILRLRAS